MNKCFGIISYIPQDEPARSKRIVRLNKLLLSLNKLFPDIPIIIEAQGWSSYIKPYEAPSISNPLHIYRRKKMGIIGARNQLRIDFLSLDYNWLIMLDDDAIVEESEENSHIKYMQELDEHDDGYIITNFEGSQLNFLAISKNMYLNNPLPNINAEKSEGFEDEVFANYLRIVYPEKELPSHGLRSCHFRNPDIDKLGGEVPSTWARTQQRNWKRLRLNTKRIIDYIKEHKKYPDESFWKNN